MILRRIIFVTVSLTLLFCAVGCGNDKDNAVLDFGEADGMEELHESDGNKKGASVPLNMGGGMSASRAEAFVNIKELKENTEEIVRLKIISTETKHHEGLNFTLSEARVLKVINGNDIAEGDTIKLIQTGAIIDGIENSIFGDPIYRVDDEMILFLKKSKSSFAENVYRSIGISDGRFDIIDSKVVARGLGYSESEGSDFEEMSFDDINELRLTVGEFEERIR